MAQKVDDDLQRKVKRRQLVPRRLVVFARVRGHDGALERVHALDLVPGGRAGLGVAGVDAGDVEGKFEEDAVDEVLETAGEAASGEEGGIGSLGEREVGLGD